MELNNNRVILSEAEQWALGGPTNNVPACEIGRMWRDAHKSWLTDADIFDKESLRPPDVVMTPMGAYVSFGPAGRALRELTRRGRTLQLMRCAAAAIDWETLSNTATTQPNL
jgi:hypothetical protein